MSRTRLRLLLLGPLEVWAGDRPLPLGGPRQQRAIATLLIDAGQVVPLPRLIDAVWEEHPPASARRQVQDLVSRLRGSLRDAGVGDDMVRAERHGYRLSTTGHEYDAHEFDRLMAESRRLAGLGDRAAEAVALRAALDLWRGPALTGLGGRILAAVAERLDQRRASAWERSLSLDLEFGRAADVIDELAELVAHYPMRERPVELLMLALHRTGRRSEALECYRQFRNRLAEELGLDPSAQLGELHRAVLRGEPVRPSDAAVDSGPAKPAASAAPVTEGPAVPPAAGPRPAQLPAVVRNFVGRAAELASLDALLDCDPPTAVIISAISGTAGVGKSALAVHWAHRVADRFPDGQLYVNLRGFDPGGRAMAAADALRGFLDALGVPAQRIPADFDAMVGLYRSLLAGKRMLIVLDNARDAYQVRPLLPGAPTALVVVTSRNRLSGLVAVDGADPIGLELLSPAEARALLAGRLGTDRVAAEPQAVDDIIDRSARLPLALVVVAAQAAMSPQFPLHALADGLADTRGSLPQVGDEDAAGDVRSVFSWSYRLVSPAAARLFRLLGLHPGPDIGRAAAASLASLAPAHANSMLTELTNAHLLAEPAPGRFAFHDLLRTYANGLARAEDSAADRHAAMHRLVDHYLHTADVAAMRVVPPSRRLAPPAPQPGVTPEPVGDHAAAMAWFAAECRVLLALIEQAAADGFDGHVWQLAWHVWQFFEFRGLWDEWLTTARAAVGAADRLGDPLARRYAHLALALGCARVERYDEARNHLQRAVDQHAELHDEAGYARLRLSQGWVAGLHGYHAEALDHARQALEVFERLGDRLGTAHSLASMARHHTNLGDHRCSLATAQRALAVHDELNDAYGRADTLDQLGLAHHHLGTYPAAVVHYERAIALHRGLGDRYAEADTLHQLGVAHNAAGSWGAARTNWSDALRILDELDHPDADNVRIKIQDLDRPTTYPQDR
jgi:DNA-binding SARP family transcriptional activator